MGQRVLLVSRRSLYIMVQYEWHRFRTAYPHADFKKFSAGPQSIEFEHDGIAVDVFREDITPDGPFPTAVHHYGDAKLNAALLKALGPRDPKNKTVKISPSPWPKDFTVGKINYPVPAVAWHTMPPKTNFSHLTLEVAPGKKISLKVRNVFKNSETEFKSAAAAKKWLEGPSMTYWAQQLNFAVWAATAGCGVGLDMLQRSSFLQFHVIFTIRRLLHELGAPLPGDIGFNAYDSHYKKAAYERLCNEFKTYKDFRFLAPNNGGVGDPYGYDYRGLNIEEGGWPNPENRFRDEGKPKYGGPEIEVLKDARTFRQYDWFVLQKGEGLVNLARINRSIEAYVYCVLGAQVDTRSPIIAAGGASRETQQQFLVLFESAVIENDIAKSIQRYQFAVQEAKVRLDYAIAPGCWLMPSDLVINTHAVAGYNNVLQKATEVMKFGINDINGDLKRPVPDFDTPPKKKPPPKKEKIISPPKKKQPLPTIKEEYDHDLLKGGITAAAVGLGYFMLR